MAESIEKIDIEELKKDIEALKSSKNDEEIDMIMSKYSIYFDNEEKDNNNAEAVSKPKVVSEKPKGSKKKEETKGRSYNGKYEIYQVGDDFQYHLKASNGEILFVSEAYTSKDGVIKAIDALKRNLETGELKIFKDKRENYKFKLISKNYRILAISSTYSQEKSAIRASESFISFAQKADIVYIEYEDTDVKTASIIEINKAEPKQGGKFEVESFDGEYSWDLKASNGQILCQAEGFTSKKGCMNSIEAFKKNISEGTFKSVKDKNGLYCFKLYTPQGRVCAIGESYQTKQGAESAANSVVSFYENAEMEFKELK